MLRTITNIAVVAFTLFFGIVGTAIAQPKTIVAFELTDPSAVLSSPKDAELRASLGLLPQRWEEFVAGVGEPELRDASPVVEALFTLASRPMRFAITDSGADPETGAPGIGLALCVDFDSRDQAHEFHDTIGRALGVFDAPEFEPSREYPGMFALPTPLGEGAFGPIRGVGGLWEYRLILGKSDAAMSVFPLAGDDAAYMASEIDLAALTPFLAPMLKQQSPELADALTEIGMLGPDAFSIEMSASQTPDTHVLHTVARGAAAHMEGMGMAPGFEIRDEDLAIVPSSAVMGYVFGLNPEPIVGFMDTLRADMPKFADAVSDLERRCGFAIPADLVEPLAPLCAFYTSPDTGSSGLLGGVLVLELDDAGALADRVARLAREFNAFTAEALTEPGERFGIGVRVRRADHPQGAAFTFEVPGLPIPVEPTLMIGERFAAVGLWPAGATVALDQAHGRGDHGLLANQRIAGDIAAPGPRTLIEFYDGPAVMDRGYTVASMLLTSLANSVRSPEDIARGASRPIPSYRELADGARASVSVTWIDGEDLRTRSVMDPSMTVMLTQVAPLVANMQAVVVLPMIVGIMLPALDRAKSNANALMDTTQLKQLHTAAVVYATDNNDRFPDSFDSLLEDGSIVPEMLVSPLGSVHDGKGDYFMRPNARNTFRAEELQMYSRASYLYGDGVSVVYGDNFAETVDFMTFFDLIDSPLNRDVDWQLPEEK